ncbi:MAG: exosortase-associated protein EpsI, B-type [Burkholderiales bacterium]
MLLRNGGYYMIGLLMIAAVGLTKVATPHVQRMRAGAMVDLNTLIPVQFGEWKEQPELNLMVIDPATQQRINAVYNQTLSRTYIDPAGDRVMLAIAYGSNQSDDMQVHKPENCYPTQGFQITGLVKTVMALPNHRIIPVKRMVATHDHRVEPITYWTTVGNKVEVDGLRWKLAQLRYGLTGVIPDGLLFRVSSIDKNVQHAYALQNNFVDELVESLNAKDRSRIIGAKNAP